MAMNSLGGKSDRRQWILDLVCHAPRHLAPGCLLLSPQQVRKVFEHQHISQSFGGVPQGGHGYRNIQLSSRQGKLNIGCRDAHTIGTAEQRFQILEQISGHHLP